MQNVVQRIQRQGAHQVLQSVTRLTLHGVEPSEFRERPAIVRVQGNRAIEVHHRRRRQPRELVIQGNDARPVSLASFARSRMARGDRCLQEIRATGGAKTFGAL